jgi:hypothetical protein
VSHVSREWNDMEVPALGICPERSHCGKVQRKEWKVEFTIDGEINC